MKIQLVEFCQQCRYFDDGWGARCFHPEVITHGKDGLPLPKQLDEQHYPLYPIPEWCPLPEAEKSS